MAETFPDWITDLRPLAAVAGTLVTVATNPVQFLQGPVLEIVLDAFVIRPATWVLGYLLQAFGILQDVILDLPPILSRPAVWIGDAIVGAVTGVYGGIRGVLEALGLAAPVASAVAVAVALILVVTIAVAVWKLIPGSDITEGVTQWTS